jgi:type I restriction enzyme S subunit
MANHEPTWPMRAIGELLKQVRNPVDVKPNKIYREIGIRSHCKGIFHKPETTGKQIGEKRVFLVEPNCLVLNIVFAWEQAVAMTSDAEVGMIASHRFPMYCSRSGKLLPEYVWRYFSTLRGKYDLTIASPGGAGRNKTLGQEEFKQLKIPVPPIEYQREVIDALATMDRAISGTEKYVAAKRLLKKGLAQRLLTGQRRLPGFSRRWEVVRMDEICRIVMGATPARKSAHFWAQGSEGHPWAVIRDLNDGWINLTAERITDAGVTHSRAKLIPQGTTLMSFKLTIGKVARAGIDLYTNEAIAAFFPKDSRVTQAFLFLSLPRAGMQVATDQAIKGVTLNKNKLSGMLLRLPPREEQDRIATVLGAADREIILLERKLAALREMKKGVMQKLLTGPVKMRT